MARKYSKGATKKVARAMHKRKKGTLKSGRSGKKVKSRKQAIAIGLSEARKEGKKSPQEEIGEEVARYKKGKKVPDVMRERRLCLVRALITQEASFAAFSTQTVRRPLDKARSGF